MLSYLEKRQTSLCAFLGLGMLYIDCIGLSLLRQYVGHATFKCWCTELLAISLGVLSLPVYLRLHGRFFERECRPRGSLREVRP
jgi:hypothetical protein